MALLRKDPNKDSNVIENFRPITLPNAELMILTREQRCAVPTISTHDSLHLTCYIIESVDNGWALINLDQPKAFKRVDHRYLAVVLKAARFGPTAAFYSCVCSVIRMKCHLSEPFSILRSIRQASFLSSLHYV